MSVTTADAQDGTWTSVAAETAAQASGLCNPLLLTDGTVIVQGCATPNWYRLTPDLSGSYANGTWSTIASLPMINGTQYLPQQVQGTQYAPRYFASAVLPEDGRVLIMGGEYNGAEQVWTNMGAIYDPVSNTWTAVSPPSGSGWGNVNSSGQCNGGIGDAESVVLASGAFMLSAACAKPAVDALFDEGTLSWTTTGAPNAGGNYQDEQGYTLLPNDNVLTIDIWTDYNNGNPTGNPRNAEQFIYNASNPSTSYWTGAGDTLASLVDPYECGNWEIGPTVLRPDGTVVAFGGVTNSTGTCGGPDPTGIYNSSTGVWNSGPYIPDVCVNGYDMQLPFYCNLADAPAAVLPDGSILFAADRFDGSTPTVFFEFSPANASPPNTIAELSAQPDNSSSYPAFYYNFLVLPTGQVFVTNAATDVAEIYTPTGSPNAEWAPTITSIASAGGTYTVQGTQLNGLTQGAYFGDDVQAATNYPIVRITNVATGNIYYARSFNFSTMSVAPGATGSAQFRIPASVPAGAATLEAVANGIPSAPKDFVVNPGALLVPVLNLLLQ